MEKPPDEVITEVVRSLADKGLLIEAGWKSMELVMLSDKAPKIQRIEMRRAFFAGAQHLFASMLRALESGTEATESDIKRMDLIDKELREFVEEERKHF